tara:strand:- start:373 stop:513 length:141 start_codon:yes stop_codon:yes gene_type:complete
MSQGISITRIGSTIDESGIAIKGIIIIHITVDVINTRILDGISFII